MAGVGAIVGGLVGWSIAKSKGYTVKDGWKFWQYTLGGVVIGGIAGGILGYVGGVAFGATGVKTGTLASSKVSMAKVRELGKLGEKLAKIKKNTTRIKIPNKTNYRIPDILDSVQKVIGDVKYVKNLSYTAQLKDMYAYAVSVGYQFVLYVKPETVLSGTLKKMVDAGQIVLYYITGK